MSDDPGVMGNLPRSRPGRRSSKRGGDAGGSEAKPETEVTSASAPKAKSGKSAAGRAKKPATTKRTTPGKKTTAAGSASGSARGRASAGTRQRKSTSPQPDSAPRQEEATQGSTDPVTGAVLLAGKVVEGGMKVASGILKRLPRP